MIAVYVLAVIGGLTVTSLLAMALLLVVKEYADRRTAQQQADWDQHVEEAVTLSTGTIYDQLVAEHAARLDGDWAALDRGRS